MSQLVCFAVSESLTRVANDRPRSDKDGTFPISVNSKVYSVLVFQTPLQCFSNSDSSWIDGVGAKSLGFKNVFDFSETLYMNIS